IKKMNSQNLLQLAEEFGSPLYVYDAEKMQSQYNRLPKAFAKVEKLKINYAVKALSNISVLKQFKKMGSGLDTVSIQEVLLGLKAGFDPKDIIFTPNGVSLRSEEHTSELQSRENLVCRLLL